MSSKSVSPRKLIAPPQAHLSLVKWENVWKISWDPKFQDSESIPWPCGHQILDLRTPAKEGSQRLTKAYPKPALDLTTEHAEHGIARLSRPWHHDMSWPKIDRKIQKIELALEALLAICWTLLNTRRSWRHWTCCNGCCTTGFGVYFSSGHGAKTLLIQQVHDHQSPWSKKRMLKAPDPLPDTNHAGFFRTPETPACSCSEGSSTSPWCECRVALPAATHSHLRDESNFQKRL